MKRRVVIINPAARKPKRHKKKRHAAKHKIKKSGKKITSIKGVKNNIPAAAIPAAAGIIGALAVDFTRENGILEGLGDSDILNPDDYRNLENLKTAFMQNGYYDPELSGVGAVPVGAVPVNTMDGDEMD